MGKLVKFITKTHEKHKRNYVERMFNKKIHSMKIARRFEKDFWDGDRKYGYGGYKYIRG